MQQLSLIDELESAVRTGSPENRVTTLRRVTDLFLQDANRFNDEQIRVFDDVLCHLAARIEHTALAELGQRLAPVDAAPIGVIKQLAGHDHIEVAAPVLTGSRRLSTADLVEIAQSKSQAHLSAISRRATLEPALTDVLLDRGDGKVVSNLAGNAGAHFSDAGFGKLVERADQDDTLQTIVGLRKDLPGNLLRELLRRATEAVRAKILALVPPERRQQVEEVIAKITKSFGKKSEHNYSHAQVHVDQLAAAGQLDEPALLRFIQHGRRDELIVALARLSHAPIKIVAELLDGARNDAILVPCKAANLAWPTVEGILRDRVAKQPAADKIIEAARSDFARLTVGTAQRTLRFMSVHETAS
jgi:uncharacterized protein (DUF2336 family)